MKFDIYYRKNRDEIYTDLCKKIYGDEDISNPHIDQLDEDALYDLRDKYEFFKSATFDNPEELTDFIFMLHSRADYSISADMLYETIILPHIEKGGLVLNTETHQIRVVEDFDMKKISLYNTDNKNDSGQKWGYISIIKEEWDRSKCLPLDMDNANMNNINYFSYGSALGKHEKYDEVAYQDMCEL